MQKARRHWIYQLRQLVSEQFQVLFHSSTRSAFHLSLTVLVHYRSLGSIQPYRMVPADSRRIPRAPRYSGYYYQSYTYLYGAFTLCGLTFQTGSSSYTSQISQSYYPTQRRNVSGLGYSAFARHYQRNHNCFLFLRVLRCFSSPRSPLNKVISLQLIGLPHSEIFGSKVVCTYPKLIAAYHVLHRLLEPRHPPFALAFFFYK